MSDPEKSSSRWSRTYRVLIALYAAVVVGLIAMPVFNACKAEPTFKDYGKWYDAGQIVLRGGDLYEKDQGGTFQFMYPPTAAILFAALSVMGQIPLTLVLALVTTASWIASVLLSVHLVAGNPWRQHPLLYALPVVATLPFAWDMYLLGQPNLMLLACVLGAFACLRRKREWFAGALVAFAAAIKAFPVLAIVYFIWRRHWVAAISTLAFLAFYLVLVPIPFRGFHRNLADLKTWNEGMALRYEEGSIAQRPARGYSWKNQSLLAVANRLLRPVDADRSMKHELYVNVTNLPFKHVNVVIVTFALAMCLFYVSAMPAQAHRVPATDSVEYAMLVLLILMFTPLAFTYFFVWLLFPLTVATWLVLSASPPDRTRWLAWLVGCLLLMSFSLVLFPIGPAVGNLFWACVALLVGFGVKLWQFKRAPVT